MHNPNESKIHGPEAIVAGSFQLQQQLPNGRSMSLSGYVFQGESGNALQAKVDMMVAVLDETRGKAELPELEHKLREIEGAIALHTRNHDQLIAKREGGKKLSSVEQQSLQNFDTNLSHLKEQAVEGARKILELRQKYGVSA